MLTALAATPGGAQTSSPATSTYLPPGASPAIEVPVEKHVERTVKMDGPRRADDQGLHRTLELYGVLGTTGTMSESTQIRIEGKPGSLEGIQQGAPGEGFVRGDGRRQRREDRRGDAGAAVKSSCPG